MRLLSRLLIILVVCLVAIALPATPAQAVDVGPYITLDPDNGVPGTNVTIEGHNFTAHKDLDIYYYRDAANTTRVRVVQVETDEDGYFEDTFIVPESYTGAHEVLAVGTNISAAGNFTAEPGLTVSPEKGPVSTNVTVEGHGFAKNETSIELRYYLDGNYTTIAGSITANEYGWWKKSFVIPPSSRGNHKIDAEGEESGEVKDTTFEVTPGISLSKLSGSVGENITMTGSGFAANDRYITILFAGVEVATETRVDAGAAGNWTKVFKVPEMPKGTYNVTAYGESTSKTAISALSFNITSSLLLSPSAGHVGTNLTVTGSGFGANKDVDVMYDGSQSATGRTDSKGSFSATFAVPESQHGAHQVTAEIGGQTEATRSFTMESNPPDRPEPISPPDKSRVGFIGKATPTFQWSEVSDESGVRYSLQVAASANVTATGEFADPIVSVADLIGTNYTLNATEALPYGTYYWIVRAVDRAGNKSDWTDPISVQVGLLPLWAFILAIVVIAAVIGTLVYFFARRRRVHYY